MKAFVKTITALCTAGLMLAILSSFSVWLGVAFVMIFAADIINILVADYQRIQRHRNHATSGLRFSA